MINPDDLQKIQLVTFDGTLSYNTNGFAVLPTYTIKIILASVQPLSKSDIRFLAQGTHYADYFNIFTDSDVTVDTVNNGLGNYFIWKDNVFKIVSAQNYKQFTSYTTNHIATMVSRDNRIKYDGNTLNIPFPEIDSTFAPLFELIGFCSSSILNIVPVVWGYQQELMPQIPFCVVNIERVENLEITPYTTINQNLSQSTSSTSNVIYVSYRFFSYDKIQTFELMSKFKLNFYKYTFSSDKIKYGGISKDENYLEELYENRTIFSSEIMIHFNLVTEQVDSLTGNQSILTAAATLSFTQ